MDATSRLMRFRLITINKQHRTLSVLKIILINSPSRMSSFKTEIESVGEISVSLIYSSLLFLLYLLYYGYEKLINPYLMFKNIAENLLDFSGFIFGMRSLIYSSDLVFNYLNDQNYELDRIEELTAVDQLFNLKYFDLANMIHKSSLYTKYFSVFSMIICSRLFKYLVIWKPLEIIAISIKTISINIVLFAPFIITIFLGFALFGQSVFGASMIEYQTFSSSIITLIRVIFGDFNYESYYQFHSFIGTVYFCFFVIIIVIVCFNILSVVITESYEEVKVNLSKEKWSLVRHSDSPFVERNVNLVFALKKKFYKPEICLVLKGKSIEN